MASTEHPALALAGVTKHFGAVRAVDGVDLEVRRGELFGLIGHNGAGKSTLIKLMLGLLKPTAGTIRIQGAPVDGRGFRDVRRRIGWLPENVVLYDNLSGIETLRYFAKLKGADAAGCAPLLERVGLEQAADRPVREYSKGMRQRLGFAQALLGEPAVLFLDEPTTGLDPVATRDFHATLATLREQGTTVVITSHVLAELQERVDRLALLANGRVQALGSVQALRERMALPLRVTLRAAPASVPALQRALALLPLAETRWLVDGLRALCPRHAKMPLLAAIAAVPGGVDDVQVHEPTLEDVYFELAR
ncbi:ABC transporter ATP-binding protein [Aquincola sp. S2]|uniref:ABC transporter ATP-binding protein n=1 Tax=Pseudaquabacterium terrae TaxID=2732868 RepID=A0ABX2EQL1_9BURK|nr:ABC transporter ATP-binding protein [Aquabacterium terrae]NRF70955.1 ABC transporter ATP-binding protein [Aquabacterium terrae]